MQTNNDLIKILLADHYFSETLNDSNSTASDIFSSAVEAIGHLVGPRNACVIEQCLTEIMTQK
jgi:hypothetical protein